MKRILFTLILVLLPLTVLSGPDSDCMDIFGTEPTPMTEMKIIFLVIMGIVIIVGILALIYGREEK